METVTYDPNEWQLVPKKPSRHLLWCIAYADRRSSSELGLSASKIEGMYELMTMFAPRHPSLTTPVQPAPKSANAYGSVAELEQDLRDDPDGVVYCDRAKR